VPPGTYDPGCYRGCALLRMLRRLKKDGIKQVIRNSGPG